MGSLIRCFQILGLLLLTACGGRSPRSNPDPNAPAMLQVENQAFADMVIYAVSGTQRVRLGLVAGNSANSFTIPSYLLRGAGSLRFLADPIGGTRTPFSEEQSVQPGDIVSLRIPP